MLVFRISLFEMSPTMKVLLYLYILVVYTRLTLGATTTETTTAAAATNQTATTTWTTGSDATTNATSGTQVTITDVGTDLVWSDEHGLDMKGHCSFTFSVGFCGAFRLELYPDKNFSLPKYEIFIDRDSLQKYEVGIKKYCDPERRLCTNNGTGTSGLENTPLVTCNDSTWTPFWISWDEATVRLGKGDTVGTFMLKQVSDPEFKHIDYVKMGADDTNTSANYRFATSDEAVAAVPAAATTQTDRLVKHGAVIPTARTDGPVEAITPAATTTTTTTKAGDPGTATITRQPVDTMTTDNCNNARRPESENLGMVFERAANDTTISPSNPDVDELSSATSGSCAELCASRQTCVLYSINITGTCRITSECRPQVEREAGSAVLFLKYWG
ncbi:mucin-22-like [Haliotis asinina]|uniref:mucin-22-like n=1 Tax=Haliotis asinina TaxID=109174 RepID=UPI0035319902